MTAAHIAAHAAAEKRKSNKEEEEALASYNPNDLNEQWEFKIMRSTTNSFKNPQVFQLMVQQEAQAGWELLEKLDDDRVRFKRPVSARRRDGMLPPGYDPYRTRYGMSEGALAMGVITVIALAMGVVVLIVSLVD